MLYDVLKEKPPERLISRTVVWKIIDNLKNFNANTEWKSSWNNSSVFNYEWIVDPTVKVNDFNFPRKVWVALNRIRTGYGVCNASLFKWNLIDSAACDCGATEQTIPHIVLFCPLRCFAGDYLELCCCCTERSKDWLHNLDLKL